MLDHAGDELRRQRAEPIGATLIGEGVVAIRTVQRKVDVEPRAALVGEGASHERGEHPLADGDLLHRGLQHERAIGGIESARVLDVDLVLRVHELVVRGKRLQAELVTPEQHLEDDLARVGDGADGVDARELVDVAAQAVRRRRVALGKEELELRRDDRLEAAGCVGVDDALEQRPWAGRVVVCPVQCPRLAEAPGHLGLPRHRPERLEVGPDGEIDVAFLASHDGSVPQVGSHHGGAERDALLAHIGEVADGDVLASGDAVQIRVEQADCAHTEPAQRPRGSLGLLVGAQLEAFLSVTKSAPARAGA